MLSLRSQFEDWARQSLLLRPSHRLRLRRRQALLLPLRLLLLLIRATLEQKGEPRDHLHESLNDALVRLLRRWERKPTRSLRAGKPLAWVVRLSCCTVNTWEWFDAR